MVRYSVTMDDSLTETIDKSCAKRKISRSDWISEACTTHLTQNDRQRHYWYLHPSIGRTGLWSG